MPIRSTHDGGWRWSARGGWPTAVVCLLVLAGCGGSSSGGGAGATTPAPNSSSSPVGMSRCMRAHGLSTFPDPSAGAGGEGFNGIDRVAGGLIVDGISFTGPAAQAAMRACSRFLTPSGAPPPQPTAAQKQAALRFAECMRSHGVPNFADPDFSSTPRQPKTTQSNVNPQSPAFQRAVRACGGGLRRLL